MIKGMIAAMVMSVMMCGCIVVKQPEHSNSYCEYDKITIANDGNVYRTCSNIVIRVKVQDSKSGKWLDAENPVLIPSGYYIGSGK